MTYLDIENDVIEGRVDVAEASHRAHAHAIIVDFLGQQPRVGETRRVMWLVPGSHFVWGATQTLLLEAVHVARSLVLLGFDIDIDTEQPATLYARRRAGDDK